MQYGPKPNPGCYKWVKEYRERPPNPALAPPEPEPGMYMPFRNLYCNEAGLRWLERGGKPDPDAVRETCPYTNAECVNPQHLITRSVGTVIATKRYHRTT